MFANPLWSVLILLALILIYRFIISPRWKVSYADSYAHVHDFWARQWARIYAFRTPIVAAVGPVLAALPDILIFIWNVLLQFILAVPTLDLSSLPQPWPAWAMGASTFATIIMKSFETKPDGVKAA